MKRTHNEDSLYLVPQENLYIVADGMGGHASGEVASQLAVEAIAKFFEATSDDDELTWPFKMDKALEYPGNRLVCSVKMANKAIFDAAIEEPRLKGMGTTIVACQFANGGVLLAHVGDSRIYRIREGVLDQLTSDHSLLNDYIKMKELTQEEIDNFPHKNVIVRALGMKNNVEVDTDFSVPEHGDIYLLCSDGLSGMIDDPTILKIVVQYRADLEVCCDKLIEAANANGGTDNVTVVVSEFFND
jgi:protein phosphatase